MGSLIDSSLLEGLAFLFDNTVTIQVQGDNPNSFGDVEPEGWADLAEHVNLPCRIGTRSMVQDNFERDSATATTISRRKVILLKGYFPAIKEKMRAVTDDGFVWDIEFVNHDSEEVTTSLDVERIE